MFLQAWARYPHWYTSAQLHWWWWHHCSACSIGFGPSEYHLSLLMPCLRAQTAWAISSAWCLLTLVELYRSGLVADLGLFPPGELFITSTWRLLDGTCSCTHVRISHHPDVLRARSHWYSVSGLLSLLLRRPWVLPLICCRGFSQNFSSTQDHIQWNLELEVSAWKFQYARDLALSKTGLVQMHERLWSHSDAIEFLCEIFAILSFLLWGSCT